MKLIEIYPYIAFGSALVGSPIVSICTAREMCRTGKTKKTAIAAALYCIALLLLFVLAIIQEYSGS